MSSTSPERAALLATLGQEGRQFSTATVLFHQAVAERLGLNTTDHKCADILLRTGPLTAGELAETTGLTTGAMTGVVDRLERAGFVSRERDPEDRRRVIVRPTLSAERERELAGLFAPLAGAFEEICDTYSDRDLGVILEFLRRCRSMTHEQTHRLRAEGGSGEPSPGSLGARHPLPILGEG